MWSRCWNPSRPTILAAAFWTRYSWPNSLISALTIFCNPSNLDGRVIVYVCIWLGLGLASGIRLGFAMICSRHGHLCLTGCSVVTIATAKKVSHGHQNGSLWSSYLKRSVRPRVRVFWLFEINSGPHLSLLEVLITCTHTQKYFFSCEFPPRIAVNFDTTL